MEHDFFEFSKRPKSIPILALTQVPDFSYPLSFSTNKNTKKVPKLIEDEQLKSLVKVESNENPKITSIIQEPALQRTSRSIINRPNTVLRHYPSAQEQIVVPIPLISTMRDSSKSDSASNINETETVENEKENRLYECSDRNIEKIRGFSSPLEAKEFQKNHNSNPSTPAKNSEKCYRSSLSQKFASRVSPKPDSAFCKTKSTLDIVYSNLKSGLKILELEPQDSLQLQMSLLNSCGSIYLTVDNITEPHLFITKWIDYTNKYGLSYQLRDGSVGVFFNDGTSIILSADNQYKQK
jgi:hypothetical protein